MTNSSLQYSFDVFGDQKVQLSARSGSFGRAAANGVAVSCSVRRKRKAKVKPPSPLSIRWTHEERNDLVTRAEDLPVSAYARSVLFADGVKASRLSPRNPLLDHQLLGQILAQLGRGAFAPDLAILAEAVRSGSLPLDEITAKQIEDSAADIRRLRSMIMEALGQRKL